MGKGPQVERLVIGMTDSEILMGAQYLTENRWLREENQPTGASLRLIGAHTKRGLCPPPAEWTSCSPS